MSNETPFSVNEVVCLNPYTPSLNTVDARLRFAGTQATILEVVVATTGDSHAYRFELDGQTFWFSHRELMQVVSLNSLQIRDMVRLKPLSRSSTARKMRAAESVVPITEISLSGYYVEHEGDRIFFLAAELQLVAPHHRVVTPPTLTVYNTDDRVRLNPRATSGALKRQLAGHVYPITGRGGDPALPYLIYANGYNFAFATEELEAIREEYHVGDHVRLRPSPHIGNSPEKMNLAGMVAIVSAIADDGDIVIQLAGGGSWLFESDELDFLASGGGGGGDSGLVSSHAERHRVSPSTLRLQVEAGGGGGGDGMIYTSAAAALDATAYPVPDGDDTELKEHVMIPEEPDALLIPETELGAKRRHINISFLPLEDAIMRYPTENFEIIKIFTHLNVPHALIGFLDGTGVHAQLLATILQLQHEKHQLTHANIQLQGEIEPLRRNISTKDNVLASTMSEKQLLVSQNALLSGEVKKLEQANLNLRAENEKLLTEFGSASTVIVRRDREPVLIDLPDKE